MFGSHDRLERHLRDSGSKALAVVLESQDTGGRRRHADGSIDNEWKVKLSLRPAQEPEFDAEIKQNFRSSIPPLPGAKLEALYDPSDHSRVVIDMRYMEGIDPRPGELKKTNPAAYEKRMDPEAVQLRSVALHPQMASAVLELGPDGRPRQLLTPDGRPVAPGSSEGIQRIEMLAELRERGIITDGEFEFHKQLTLAQ